MTKDPYAGANVAQRELAELPVQPILLLAPPGCGKTEALAFRATGLVHSGHVRSPQKILALTFSNKARDNLRDRLHRRLGTGHSRRFVTVQNFHGFAARIFNGHQHLLGLSEGLEMPDRRWAASQTAEVGASRKAAGKALDVIRQAKQAFLHDDDVADAVIASGDELAIELERRRLAAGKLDFDDLIRYGVTLLNLDPVRRLYRTHFAAVLVDEMQDMTVLQLELALLVGKGRTTLAGDAAQGIYGFAGAQPDEVASRFEAEEPEIFVLTENYRSAPAVLNMVSSMAESIGGTAVCCASPSEWVDEGEIRVLRFDSAPDEAEQVLDMVERLLAAEPGLSVGVIARNYFRKRWIEEAATDRNLQFECWDRSVDSHHVRTILHRALPEVPRGESRDEQLRLFCEACLALCHPDEVDLRDNVLGGIDVVRELLERGTDIETALATLSVRPSDVVAPGLHFLNAHVGKGQQFDWVIVLGMEKGVIPSYHARTQEEEAEELRVLHVMCSRARRGLLFTASRDVRWDPTKEWIRQESPWLAAVGKYTTGEGDPTLFPCVL